MCEKEGLTIKIYAEGSGGKVQDSYSRWKERIYDDPLGRAHEEDIKMRHIENKEGGNKMVMWKDKKGRVIDIAADNPYPDNPKAKRYNTK